MDPRPPDRLEELLTRAFDGEASPEERAELDRLAIVEPRLAMLADLRQALRDALAVPGPVDVAGDVMGILAEEERWSPIGAALADAVRQPVDVADEVMSSITFADVGAALRDAVSDPVDLADDIFAAIAAEADFAPLGAELRAALAGPAPTVDLADAVMARLAAGPGIEEATIDTAPDADAFERELSAYADDELDPERIAAFEARLAADPAARARLEALDTMGEAIRGATRRGEDLWAGIAAEIGQPEDVVFGWEDTAAELRAAFAALPKVDVTDAVMREIGAADVGTRTAEVVPLRPVAPIPPTTQRPRRAPTWLRYAGPAGMLAMAAAALFALLPGPSPESPALQLATVNDAQVEDIDVPADTVVQVMQFEDGGPTFILIEDPGVPL